MRQAKGVDHETGGNDWKDLGSARPTTTFLSSQLRIAPCVVKRLDERDAEEKFDRPGNDDRSLRLLSRRGRL